MNEGDIANKSHDETLGLIISKRVRFDRPSQEDCIDCGAEIPLQRRELGSVERCIHCQGTHEAKSKHYRKT